MSSLKPPPMDKAQILALADRVEALTGPDRGVDMEVAIACGWARNWSDQQYRKHPYLVGTFIDDHAAGVLHTCPAFSASLDAAMTLVPEGVGGEPLMTKIMNVPFATRRPPANCEIIDTLTGRGWTAEAAIPALALTAASLRAMAGGEDA